MLGHVVYKGGNSVKLLQVVTRLVPFISRVGNLRATSVEARQNGVEVLASILSAGTSVGILPCDIYSGAFDAFLPGFNDYTNDQRGDVGSWIRATTLRSLSSLLPGLLDGSSPFSPILTQSKLDFVIGSMLKLAVERIDTVREAAGTGLMRSSAAETSEGGPVIRGHRHLLEISSEQDSRKWRDLAWSCEQILPLLTEEEYRPLLLEGGLIATNRHSSSSPFLDFLVMLPATGTDDSEYSLLQALRDLYVLARKGFGSNRIFVPFLFILSSLAEAGRLEEIIVAEASEGAKWVKMSLAIAVNSVAKMKAPQRVGASSKVVTAFLAVPSIGSLAAEKIPLFLLHNLAWIRQETADDLFGVLSTLPLDEQSTELESVLSETNWSSTASIEEANRVSELLKIALEREL